MTTPEEMREMEHKHIKMSYNKINDLLYAGNNMCCQTHFEEELLSKGITTDISLESERLDNLEEQKSKTYVHCKNGHGRTSTFLASYFIRKMGSTADEALEIVREKRPSMHLNDIQKDFLRDFAKTLKGE